MVFLNIAGNSKMKCCQKWWNLSSVEGVDSLSRGEKAKHSRNDEFMKNGRSFGKSFGFFVLSFTFFSLSLSLSFSFSFSSRHRFIVRAACIKNSCGTLPDNRSISLVNLPSILDSSINSFFPSSSSVRERETLANSRRLFPIGFSLFGNSSSTSSTSRLFQSAKNDIHAVFTLVFASSDRETRNLFILKFVIVGSLIVSCASNARSLLLSSST